MEGSSEQLFTQQIDNSFGDEGDEGEFGDGVYGKLLSMTADFPDISLSADVVTMGRQGSCTVPFKNNQVRAHSLAESSQDFFFFFSFFFLFFFFLSTASELGALHNYSGSNFWYYICDG